jgi:general secretion pathway protein B
MSYILDALRRADAERDRGAVPGLHARQVSTPTLTVASGAKNRLWLALAAAVVLGALAAGLWLGRSGTVTASGVEVTPSAPAQPAVTEQPTVASQPLPLPVSSPQPTVAVAPEPATTPTAPQSRAAAAIVVPTSPVVEKATPAPQAKPSASLPETPSVLAPPWLAELPEDTRRQLPPLAITGAVYSDNPAQRLLLINGLVLPPGGAVTPDVTLEDIRERHSVFSFRGTRFRLAH